MFENLLPIGTIVLLKKTSAKIMITGYKQVNSKDKLTVKDYTGVIYPIGNIGSRMGVLFDEDDIQDVIYMGYKNSEFTDLIVTLEKAASDDPKLSQILKNKKMDS